MKSKVINGILLVAVAFVWSYIVHFIYTSLKDSDPSTEYTLSKPRKIEIDSLKREFNYSFNYPDPFLKKETSRISENKEKRTTSVNPIKVPTPSQLDWTRYRYLGMVENTHQKHKKAGIISIDQQISFVGQGTSIEALEIITIDKDSILLQGNGVRKWVRKE